MSKTISVVDADGFVLIEHTFVGDDDGGDSRGVFGGDGGKIVPTPRPVGTNVSECRWTGSKWDVGPHVALEHLHMRVQALLVDKCKTALASRMTLDPDVAATKYAAAQEFLADDKAPALALRSEAERTGEKLKTLAEKIVKNYKASQKSVGVIEGIRRSLPAQVAKIKKLEQAQMLMDSIDKELSVL